MKKPRRKRKPLVVWGVACDDSSWETECYLSKREAACRLKEADDWYGSPMRVVKFVEVVR